MHIISTCILEFYVIARHGAKTTEPCGVSLWGKQ
nr:MAG TPA: hypothetical protein [Caudoviricetes sp.]